MDDCYLICIRIHFIQNFDIMWIYGLADLVRNMYAIILWIWIAIDAWVFTARLFLIEME